MLKVTIQMAEKLTEHPILLYLIFVLPMALLALGIISGANVFLLIVVATYLGVALVIFFIPIESDLASQ